MKQVRMPFGCGRLPQMKYGVLSEARSRGYEANPVEELVEDGVVMQRIVDVTERVINGQARRWTAFECFHQLRTK